MSAWNGHLWSFWWLFWVALVVVLFALFNSADRGRRKNFSHELLQERYDLGEIAYKEYEERKAKVEHVSKAGDWKS